ncbi:hypothetical protein L6164_015487 [Bauhinia variegata]|uniref:Uncharacterized protein n=1 Tax=Bauhinia variegata TaxID=167791 RepID=A0ACB9NM06_BAUVA|nr:hypothetical protein L6164_015487 [Bauhinia variegata]
MNDRRQSSSAKQGSSTFTPASPGTCPSDCRCRRDVLPETLLQNPYRQFSSDQTLVQAFSGLSISSQPFDFAGHNTRGSTLNSAAKDFIFGGRQFSQPSKAGQPQQRNNGFQRPGWDDDASMRSQNHWFQTDIWGCEGFGAASYPATGVNGYTSNHDWSFYDFTRSLRQKEIGRAFPTFPIQNGDGSYVDLQQISSGTFNDLLSYRTNISGFNVNAIGRRPHWSHQQMNYLSISDLRGKILLIAKDQYGCRQLQEAMKGLKPDDISTIFFELIDHVSELMLDSFGNYVVQKLIEVCTEEQRTQIILMVTKDNFQLVNICLDMHGTRAVQKLLEHATTRRQRSLIMSAIGPGAVPLTKDMNGHHVILHCLRHFSDEDNEYLLTEVAKNCFGIATDKSGCCVLQHCVNHAQGETKERLMAQIIGNASLLAEDCYGNYVVQHLVSLKMPRVTECLMRQLEGRFVSLSCNKYGSNVVEKLFQESGAHHSTRIIWELVQHPNVSMLFVDPYGNYVIQSALTASKGPLRNTLQRLIQDNSEMMRSNLYGKKLLVKFDKEKLRHNI